jgi:hypothetical protein
MAFREPIYAAQIKQFYVAIPPQETMAFIVFMISEIMSD